jgi:hypothetical protein
LGKQRVVRILRFCAGRQGQYMQRQLRLVSAVAACVLLLGNPSLAADPESAYRVLRGPGACLPCGGAPYVVIDSQDKVHDLYAGLKEACRDAQSPERWRNSVTDLGVDFESEAIVAMYEVIGTGGKPSLEIAGPREGVLRAAIAWDKGPPPHVPIATAGCITFAVKKSAVHTVTIIRGGVLNKTKEELSLRVSESRPNTSLKPTNPAQASR